MSCISTSLQHCGNTWNSPHTASSHGKASSLVWSSKTSSETKTDHLYHAMRALGIGLPYQQRKCISSTFHSETELRPLQLTYSRPPPPHLHIDSTFPEHTPHSHILMPRSTNQNSHLLLQLPTVMQTERENFAGRGKVIFFFNIGCVCLWRSYTNILSFWYRSYIDTVQGQLWLFLPDS